MSFYSSDSGVEGNIRGKTGWVEGFCYPLAVFFGFGFG